MSRNSTKIAEALRRKEYFTETVLWNPIRRGPEMCGPEGGWYIEVWSDREFIDIICAYSVEEALEQIEKLPFLAATEPKGEATCKKP